MTETPAPDMGLLKSARARDDQDFVWRVSAAMTVEAQYRLGANPDMSGEERQLMDWVLENPMTPQPLMLAFASTDPAVVEGIAIDDGAVTTALVKDAAIQGVVGQRWKTVAARRFGAKP